MSATLVPTIIMAMSDSQFHSDSLPACCDRLASDRQDDVTFAGTRGGRASHEQRQ